jgi:hypothetical protein
MDSVIDPVQAQVDAYNARDIDAFVASYAPEVVITDDAVDDSPNVVVESVSNADSGTQMRVSGGMYLYNLSTKGLKQATDYTLRVRSGSSTGPVILKALLQPKK